MRAQVYTRWLTSGEKPWLEELESLEVGARWWPQGVGSPRFQSRYSIPRLISTGWLAVSSIIGPNSCYVSATRGARPMPLPVQLTLTRISLCSICAYACLSFHVGYGCFASVQSRYGSVAFLGFFIVQWYIPWWNHFLFFFFFPFHDAFFNSLISM